MYGGGWGGGRLSFLLLFLSFLPDCVFVFVLFSFFPLCVFACLFFGFDLGLVRLGRWPKFIKELSLSFSHCL